MCMPMPSKQIKPVNILQTDVDVNIEFGLITYRKTQHIHFGTFIRW